MATDTLAPARYVRLGPKAVVQVGSLAGTGYAHRFIGDNGSGSSCLACFDWCDAPQHLIRVPRVRKRQ